MRSHEIEDERRFGTIETALNLIKDNHLAHIEKDMGRMSEKQAETRTDMKWVIRLLLAMLIPMIGGFVGLVYQLVTTLE